jgi:hypothetical protein
VSAAPTATGAPSLAVSRPAATVLTGVLAGAVLTTWVGEVAFAGSPGWATYHQVIDGAYSRFLPPLGALALVVVLAAAVTSRGRDRRLLLGAVACLVTGLAVTLAVHFPINAEIAAWDAVAPPAGWEQLQQRWVDAHHVRTALTVAALLLCAVVSARRRA